MAFDYRVADCWCEGPISTVIGKRWATKQDLSLRTPFEQSRWRGGRYAWWYG
jgi:hypothetical protein